MQGNSKQYLPTISRAFNCQPPFHHPVQILHEFLRKKSNLKNETELPYSPPTLKPHMAKANSSILVPMM